MKLIKLIDCEGESHYINKRYIISVRPFISCPIENRNSKVEYGTGFVDCIYMKEPANEVVSLISREYIR